MHKSPVQKLIFIYNADSGFFNTIANSFHKIFRPSTYKCSLCKLTYRIFKESFEWQMFRKQSHLNMQFLHKNDFDSSFVSKFNHRFTFPIVLVDTGDEFEVFITTEELNELKNSKELIELIKQRIG